MSGGNYSMSAPTCRSAVGKTLDTRWYVGGSYGFYPCANFFFWLLTRNKPFFPSQTQPKEQANFFPLYNPIFLPVLWRNFYFLQFAQQTISHQFLLNHLFFPQKAIAPGPPPNALSGWAFLQMQNYGISLCDWLPSDECQWIIIYAYHMLLLRFLLSSCDIYLTGLAVFPPPPKKLSCA